MQVNLWLLVAWACVSEQFCLEVHGSVHPTGRQVHQQQYRLYPIVSYMPLLGISCTPLNKMLKSDISLVIVSSLGLF